MTESGIGDLEVPAICASYREMGARSWNSVGMIRADVGVKLVMEKRTPLLWGEKDCVSPIHHFHHFFSSSFFFHFFFIMGGNVPTHEGGFFFWRVVDGVNPLRQREYRALNVRVVEKSHHHLPISTNPRYISLTTTGSITCNSLGLVRLPNCNTPKRVFYLSRRRLHRAQGKI